MNEVNREPSGAVSKRRAERGERGEPAETHPTAEMSTRINDWSTYGTLHDITTTTTVSHALRYFREDGGVYFVC